MRRVEHHPRSDVVGDPAHRGQVVGEEHEARPDQHHRGSDVLGPARHPVEIHVHPRRIERDVVNRQAVETRGTVSVVRCVARRGLGDDHDRIARTGERHEGVEVGERPTEHPDLCERGMEQRTREFGRDDLDTLRVREPRFVLVTRVPEARSGSQRAAH